MSSTAADLLAQFHEFFGYDDPVTSARLRLRLINEEHEELVDELRAAWTLGLEYDKRKVYKEAADLLYVLYGLDLHLGGYLDRALEEVHKANMSKLWACERCDGTGYTWDGESFSEDAGGRLEDVCSECNGQGHVVKKREDGKILKPPTYQAPDLSFIE